MDYFDSVLTSINADISRGEALPVEEQRYEGMATGRCCFMDTTGLKKGPPLRVESGPG
jgi:hypothetical protein